MLILIIMSGFQSCPHQNGTISVTDAYYYYIYFSELPIPSTAPFQSKMLILIIISVFRAAGHEFHAEHLQPGGRDAQAQTTEAGEEAPTVPLQGIILF
jgi:hypothetical protein